MTLSNEDDGQSVERRARAELGFYPSYLAALEPYPEAADLVWRESRRVLHATWAPSAARRLASTAQPAVSRSLPVGATVDRSLSEDETDSLRAVVRFFSFVVFRLGLSIGACRYALDGAATRAAHRRPLPAETVPLSPCVDAGVETTLPATPSLSLVSPEAAGPEVRATFGRVREVLETPNVNTVFRALASVPAVLEAVLDMQAEFYETLDARWAFERSVRGWYATSLDGDSAPRSLRPALRTEGVERRTVDEVAGRLRTFHENLPTLVVTVLVADRLLEDA